MYIYNQGAVSEAVHKKLESVKQSVRGEKGERIIFSDVLRSHMTNTKNEVKTVSAAGNSSSPTASGSSLIYAMQNADTDTTASAVLDLLGYKGPKNTLSADLKASADKLSASAAQLKTVSDAGVKESERLALEEFVSNYNELVSKLSTAGTSSGYLYLNALAAYASGAPLEEAGITADPSGKLTVSETSSAAGLSAFLSGTAAVAKNVSEYSSGITGSENTEENSSGYYSSLLDLLR